MTSTRSMRVEGLARLFVIVGVVIGVVTVALVVLRPNPDERDGALGVDDLGSVREQIIYERERDDLGSGGRRGRTVVVSVPQAADEREAGAAVLSSLGESGWLVSARGAAIRRDGTVCLAVSTPTSWLAQAANAEFRGEVRRELAATRTVAVVIDLFYCSDAQRK